MLLPISGINPISLGGLPKASPSTDPTSGGSGGGFGKMLADSIGQIDQAQAQANQQTQALATGQASDVSSVVMSVEQASLEVQLASQIDNKAVSAYQDIFRMQV
ncbi:MAG TPA: flagellar hook-basal body complex protein FliE [Gaiellaceae bacterium]|nr:flagellar hook-basal body complex protein FliE [Gaiellaceae bacterium]